MHRDGSSPRPPFSSWPVQLFISEHGFYWYARPAAVVCQTVVPYGSLEVVDAHNDVLDRVLSLRRDEVQAEGGLLIFNDWRTLKSFEPGARSRMQERMNARARGYARRTVVVVNPSNRLLRMAIEAASLFKTLVFGTRIDVALSPELPLAQAGLSPPPSGESFPGFG